MATSLVNLLADLKEDEAIRTTKERLAAGEDPLKILEETRKGMGIVGQRFASREYFLPDLVYSAEILKQISVLLPLITRRAEFHGLCPWVNVSS